MAPQGTTEWIIWSLLYMLLLIANGLISVSLYKRRVRKRAEKFLRVVRIDNPGATITFIAVESSDEDALDKIKQQYTEVR